MTTIVTRASKGSPLSWSEADANFTNLNTDKLEVTTAASTYPTKANNLSDLANAATARTNLSISATNTPNTPAGSIVATDVQAALNELDTEKLALTGGTMTGAIKNTASQIGTSSTATNNFSFEPTTTGAMKLGRGNAGSTTQDIMTVDNTGIVTFPQNHIGNMLGVSAVSTTQALSALTTTVLKFPTEDSDPYSAYDPSTGEFTVPYAGIYLVTGTVRVLYGSTGGELVINVQKNGSLSYGANHMSVPLANSTTWATFVSQNTYSAGDKIRVVAYVENAATAFASATNHNYVRIMKIG